MSGLADELQWMPATEQAALVRRGEATPLELLDAAIARMERLNPAVNAVTVSWLDDAREAARSLPDDGQPLRGVPILLKDLHAQLLGTPLTNGNAQQTVCYGCHNPEPGVTGYGHPIDTEVSLSSPHSWTVRLVNLTAIGANAASAGIGHGTALRNSSISL